MSPKAKSPLPGLFHEDETTEEEWFIQTCEHCRVEGLLTAIAISPVFIPPAEWLEAILPRSEMSEEEAILRPQIDKELMETVDEIRSTLRGSPRNYAPMYMNFDPDPQLAMAWGEGFCAGMHLRRDTWNGNCAGDDTYRVMSIAMLGLDDEALRDAVAAAATETPDLDALRMEMAETVPENVVALFRRWHGKAPAEEPGRNDPCPCGSGRKYKKCCLSEN